MTFGEMVNDCCAQRGLPPIAAKAVMAQIESESPDMKDRWNDSGDKSNPMQGAMMATCIRSTVAWVKKEIERELLNRLIRSAADWIEANKPTT